MLIAVATAVAEVATADTNSNTKLRPTPWCDLHHGATYNNGHTAPAAAPPPAGGPAPRPRPAEPSMAPARGARLPASALGSACLRRCHSDADPQPTGAAPPEAPGPATREPPRPHGAGGRGGGGDDAGWGAGQVTGAGGWGTLGAGRARGDPGCRGGNGDAPWGRPGCEPGRALGAQRQRAVRSG